MRAANWRQRWHAYYTEKRIVHQWFQVDLLKNLEVQKVLEVGPHYGLVSAMLVNAGYEVTTLDISPDPLRPGVAGHVAADVRDVQVEQLAGHDAIICCETLEHIPWEDVGGVVACFSASGVPWLIVSVPYSAFQFGFSLYFNRYIWRKQSFLKKLHFLSSFPTPTNDGWEDHKWEIGFKGYTVPRLRELLTESGYEILRQDFTSGCRSIFLVCRNRQSGEG